MGDGRPGALSSAFRFLSIDPKGFEDTGTPAMFGRYTYVGNDPVNGVDPDGECPWCIPIAIFLAKEAVAEVASRVTHGATDWISVKGLGKKLVRSQAKRNLKKQLKKNIKKGKRGEALTRKKLKGNIAGEQVTLESSSTGKKARMDFVKKDGGVVETKTGNAQLTPNQRAVKADIDAGRDVIPRGQKAAEAGLEPNKAVKLPSCKIDRPC